MTGPPTLGSLCSGYGGLDMAVAAHFGAEVVWHSEVDPSAAAVLERRWPGVPNLGDLRGLTPPPVDIVAVGFPCQPVSMAGRRKGLHDDGWLWPDIVATVGRMDPPPRVWVCENTTGLLTVNGGDAMASVLQGLHSLRFVGRWAVVRAADVGAPHRRARWFAVAAHSDGIGFRGFGNGRGNRGTGVRGDVAFRGGHVAPDSPCDGRNGSVPVEGPRLGFANGGDVVAANSASVGRSRSVVASSDVECDGSQLAHLGAGTWGEYWPAIARWERIVGRSAPVPSVRGERRSARLNPRLVEWMMGLPDGWVTDVLSGHGAVLRVLGNGVVPQQAALALEVCT